MNENLLILNKSQLSGNYIITSCIGKKYFYNWRRICEKNWLKYCQKYDIGLAVLVDPITHSNTNVFWQKYLIGSKLAEKVNLINLCFLDYDILISPFALNIFENVDLMKVNLVSQSKNLPYSNNSLEIRKKISFFRKAYLFENFPLDSSILFSPNQSFAFHGLKQFNDMACMGVFVYSHNLFNKYLEDLVEKYSTEKSIIDAGDEIFLNYELQSASLVNWIHYKWQTLWIYESAVIHSHLYRSKFENDIENYNAISSSLVNSYFLHFAGSVEKRAFDLLSSFWNESDYKFFEHLGNYLKSDVIPKSYGKICLKNG